MRKTSAVDSSIVITLTIVVVAAACSEPGSALNDRAPLHSSRAYKGHENEQDTSAFVAAFPSTFGTRLDDCQTCHTGAKFTYPSGESISTIRKNACDTCHLILHPDPDFLEVQPTRCTDTLNPFGLAYLSAGRSVDALRTISAEDSDGDGFNNQEEIDALKYPGDPASKPGQPVAPFRLFGMEELESLESHSQFLLANSHKQQFDNYASYSGVRVRDLLVAAGVDPSDPGIEGITVIAPDGYLKDFPMDQVNQEFPAGLFYSGLGTDSLGPVCGFVQYPEALPDGVMDGAPIPGAQWLLLAYE
ncbi:MAG: GEGP motif-containing diheme protein, partial [Coriobacteriia bacterium]|nr:GEGP motif-containing diheme protein [Coriobacteriia bacterium]